MTKQDGPADPAQLTVFAENDAQTEAAQQLAQHLNAQTARGRPGAGFSGLALVLDAGGLWLAGDGQALRGDFTRLLPRIAPANLNRELLVKAAKIKGLGDAPTAVDATAGLGEDAFLLAAAGFAVRLYECDPVIAALLRDALRRAAGVPELAAAAARMELFEEDSLAALPRLGFRPDLVLLDPMFPARQKSGLVKKKFQLLQRLERPCADEDALLAAALAARPRRVAVKRPLKGPCLAGRQPDFSLRGSGIRYDCILPPQGGAD